MNITKLFFITIFLFPFMLNAQYFDIGLQGGASNYQGDLTPETIWSSVGDSHAAIGAFARYNFNSYISTRVSFTRATISGSDLEAKSEGRRRRNLHFTSPLTEVALTGEFNIFGYTPSNLYADYSPYIFGGISLFQFNPQTEYLEQWVELQPLGTEGQGLPGYEAPYSLRQISIPFGAGFKFNINEYWTFGVEFGARKTFTDHLDDVGGYYVNYNELLETNGTNAAALSNRTGEFLNSEPIILESGVRKRGNPDNADWYFIANLTVSYNLYNKDINTSSVKSRHFGCPKRF